MEITKVVKQFIKKGRPNTFGNIVYFRFITFSTCKVKHFKLFFVLI